MSSELSKPSNERQVDSPSILSLAWPLFEEAVEKKQDFSQDFRYCILKHPGPGCSKGSVDGVVPCVNTYPLDSDVSGPGCSKAT